MIPLVDILKGVAKFAGNNTIIGLCTMLMIDKYNTIKTDVEFSKSGVSAAAVSMSRFETKLEDVTKASDRLTNRLDRFLDRQAHKSLIKGE